MSSQTKKKRLGSRRGVVANQTETLKADDFHLTDSTSVEHRSVPEEKSDSFTKMTNLKSSQSETQQPPSPDLTSHRKKLGSTRKNKGQQRIKQTATETYQELREEVEENTGGDKALDATQMLLEIQSVRQEELSEVGERDTLGTNESSMNSAIMPGYSSEVQSAATINYAEDFLEISIPIGGNQQADKDNEHFGSELTSLSAMEKEHGETDEDYLISKSEVEAFSTTAEITTDKQRLKQNTEFECSGEQAIFSLPTIQSISGENQNEQVSHPLDSQPQDTVGLEEQTNTDFSPTLNRRKLGSSRRNKEGQHVKDYVAESYDKYKEEVAENIGGNELCETPKMSLVIDTAEHIKSVETMLKGKEEFDTHETDMLSDQVMESAHCIGISQLNDSALHLALSVDQQLNNQSHTMKMRDEVLPSVNSVTNIENQERDEEIDLVMQWGIKQTSNLENKSHLKSEDIDLSVTTEVTTGTNSHKEHSELKCSTEQPRVSSPKEDLCSNEEQTEHLNLCEARETQHSDETVNKQHEEEVKSTEMKQIHLLDDSSENVIHDATENSESGVANLKDKAEVSDTYQSEMSVINIDDSATMQDDSNPDDKQVIHHLKRNTEVVDLINENNHAYDENPQTGDTERADTALVNLYEGEGQLEDNIKSTAEQTSFLGKEVLLSESKSSLETQNSEDFLPDSQPEDNSVKPDEENVTDFSHAGNRRKLGSSRRSKGRQHVKGSVTESKHKPDEEVVEDFRANEAVETTKLALALQTINQDESDQDSENNVMSVTTVSSPKEEFSTNDKQNEQFSLSDSRGAEHSPNVGNEEYEEEHNSTEMQQIRLLGDSPESLICDTTENSESSVANLKDKAEVTDTYQSEMSVKSNDDSTATQDESNPDEENQHPVKESDVEVLDQVNEGRPAYDTKNPQTNDTEGHLEDNIKSTVEQTSLLEEVVLLSEMEENRSSLEALTSETDFLPDSQPEDDSVKPREENVTDFSHAGNRRKLGSSRRSKGRHHVKGSVAESKHKPDEEVVEDIRANEAVETTEVALTLQTINQEESDQDSERNVIMSVTTVSSSKQEVSSNEEQNDNVSLSDLRGAGHSHNVGNEEHEKEEDESREMQQTHLLDHSCQSAIHDAAENSGICFANLSGQAEVSDTYQSELSVKNIDDSAIKQEDSNPEAPMKENNVEATVQMHDDEEEERSTETQEIPRLDDSSKNVIHGPTENSGICEANLKDQAVVCDTYQSELSVKNIDDSATNQKDKNLHNKPDEHYLKENYVDVGDQINEDHSAYHTNNPQISDTGRADTVLVDLYEGEGQLKDNIKSTAEQTSFLEEEVLLSEMEENRSSLTILTSETDFLPDSQPEDNSVKPDEENVTDFSHTGNRGKLGSSRRSKGRQHVKGSVTEPKHKPDEEVVEDIRANEAVETTEVALTLQTTNQEESDQDSENNVMSVTTVLSPKEEFSTNDKQNEQFSLSDSRVAEHSHNVGNEEYEEKHNSTEMQQIHLPDDSPESLICDTTEYSEFGVANLSGQAEVSDTYQSEMSVKSIDDSTATQDESNPDEENQHPVKESDVEVLDQINEGRPAYDTKNPQTNDTEGHLEDNIKSTVEQTSLLEKEVLLSEMEENRSSLEALTSEKDFLPDSQPEDDSVKPREENVTDFSHAGNRRKLGSSRRSKGRHHVKGSVAESKHKPDEEVVEDIRANKAVETTEVALTLQTTNQEESDQDSENNVMSVTTVSSPKEEFSTNDKQNEKFSLSDSRVAEHSHNVGNEEYEEKHNSTEMQQIHIPDDSPESLICDTTEYSEFGVANLSGQAEVSDTYQSEMSVKSIDDSTATQDESNPDEENQHPVKESDVEVLDQVNEGRPAYDTKNPQTNDTEGHLEDNIKSTVEQTSFLEEEVLLSEMEENRSSLEALTSETDFLPDSQPEDDSVKPDEENVTDFSHAGNRRKLGSSRRSKGRHHVKGSVAESKHKPDEEVVEDIRANEAVKTTEVALPLQTTNQEDLDQDSERNVIISVTTVSSSKQEVSSNEEQNDNVSLSDLRGAGHSPNVGNEEYEEKYISVTTVSSPEKEFTTLFSTNEQNDNVSSSGLSEVGHLGDSVNQVYKNEEVKQTEMQKLHLLVDSSQGVIHDVTGNSGTCFGDVKDQGDVGDTYQSELCLKKIDDSATMQEDSNSKNPMQESNVEVTDQIHDDKEEERSIQTEEIHCLDDFPQGLICDTTKYSETGVANLKDQAEVTDTYQSEMSVKSNDDSTATQDELNPDEENQHPVKESDVEVLDQVNEGRPAYDTKNPQTNDTEGHLEDNIKSTVEQTSLLEKEVLLSEMEENRSSLEALTSETDFLPDSQPEDDSVKPREENVTDFSHAGNRRKLGSSRRSKGRHHVKGSVAESKHKPDEEVVEDIRANEAVETTEVALTLQTINQEESDQDSERNVIMSVTTVSSSKQEVSSNEEQNDNVSLSDLRGAGHSHNVGNEEHEEEEDESREMQQTHLLDHSCQSAIHDAAENSGICFANLSGQAEVSDTYQSELSVKNIDDSAIKQEDSNPEAPMKENNVEATVQMHDDEEEERSTETQEIPRLDDSSKNVIHSPTENSGICEANLKDQAANPQISDIERADTVLVDLNEGEGQLEDNIKSTVEQTSLLEEVVLLSEMEENRSSLTILTSETDFLPDSQPEDNSVKPDEENVTDFSHTGNRRKLGSSRRNKRRQHVKGSVTEPKHKPDEEVVEDIRANEAVETAKLALALQTINQDESDQDSENNVMSVTTVSSPKEEFSTNDKQNEKFSLSDSRGAEHSPNVGNEEYEEKHNSTKMQQIHLLDDSPESLICDTTENSESGVANLKDKAEVTDTYQSEMSVKSIDDSTATQDESNPDEENQHPVKESDVEVLDQVNEGRPAYDTKNPQTNDTEGHLEDNIKSTVEQTSLLEGEVLLSEMEENRSSLTILTSETDFFPDSQPEDNSVKPDEENVTDFSHAGNRRKLGSSRRSKGRHHVKGSVAESKHKPDEEVVGDIRANEAVETTEVALTLQTINQEELDQDSERNVIISVTTVSSPEKEFTTLFSTNEQNDNVSSSELSEVGHLGDSVNQVYKNEEVKQTEMQKLHLLVDSSQGVIHDVTGNSGTCFGDVKDQGDVGDTYQSELCLKKIDDSATMQEDSNSKNPMQESNVEVTDQIHDDKEEERSTQTEEIHHLNDFPQGLICDTTKYSETGVANLKDQAEVTDTYQSEMSVKNIDYSGTMQDNPNPDETKNQQHTKENDVEVVDQINEGYPTYDTKEPQTSDIEGQFGNNPLEKNLKSTAGETSHLKKEGLPPEMEDSKSSLEILQSETCVLPDSRPEDNSLKEDEQNLTDLSHTGNRRKLGSCRRNRGGQQVKGSVDESYHKVSDEDVEDISSNEALEITSLVLQTTNQGELSQKSEHDIIMSVNYDNSVFSRSIPDYSPEVQNPTSANNPEAELESNDTTKPQTSDTERADTALVQVYDSKGQLEEIVKPTVEQISHTEKEGVLSEMDRSKTTLETLQPETDAPFHLQPEDNSVKPDEQTVTDVSPIGNRRKLGSSRRHKGRQHVKSSGADSYHKPTEDVDGNTRDNKPNETTKNSLAIETVVQEIFMETELEEKDEFDSFQTEVSDEIKVNPHVRTCELTGISMHSVTDTYNKGDKDTDLLREKGLLQTGSFVNESHLKSGDIEFSVTPVTTEKSLHDEHAEPNSSIEQSTISSPEEELSTNAEQNEHFNLSEVRGPDHSEEAVNKVLEEEDIKLTETQKMHQQPEETHTGFISTGNRRKMGSSRRKKGMQQVLGSVTKPYPDLKEEIVNDSWSDEASNTEKVSLATETIREESEEQVDSGFKPVVKIREKRSNREENTDNLPDEDRTLSPNVMDRSAIVTADINSVLDKDELTTCIEDEKKHIKEPDVLTPCTGPDATKADVIQSAEVSIMKVESDMQSISYHHDSVSTKSVSPDVLEQKEAFQIQNTETLSCDEDVVGQKIHDQQIDSVKEAEHSMDVEVHGLVEVREASEDPANKAHEDQKSNIENLQGKLKQKRRKIGSSRRLQLRATQENETEYNETNETNLTMKADVEELPLKVTTEVSHKEIVQSTMYTAYKEQQEMGKPCSVHDEAQKLHSSAPDIQSKETNMMPGTESLALHPEQATMSYNEVVNSVTQNDEQISEGMKEIQDQAFKSTQAPNMAVADSEKVQFVVKGAAEEDSKNDPASTQEPESVTDMKDASPNFSSTSRRRKLGSTRKNLGSRSSKGDDLHHKQEVDNEETATSVVESTEELHNDCSSSDSEQRTKKVIETVKYSHTGESQLEPPAHQTAEENPDSFTQLVEMEQHPTPDNFHAKPSTSPEHDAISESAVGGRRKKLGSNRKSRGHRSALNEISEVEGSDKPPSSEISISKATQHLKPVSEAPERVTQVEQPHDEVNLGQKFSLGVSRGADIRSSSYNVLMVGDSCVGKTSFMKRAQSGKFSIDLPSSVGLDTCKWTVVVDGKPVVLQIWDTAGQERFHSITRQVFHKAHAFLLMYDVTSSESFSAVSYWANCIEQGAAENVTILLLGNKCDRADRQVTTQKGENLAKECDFEFMECSAATGENVLYSLETVARMLSESVDIREEAMVLHKEPPKKKKSGCC